MLSNMSWQWQAAPGGQHTSACMPYTCVVCMCLRQALLCTWHACALRHVCHRVCFYLQGRTLPEAGHDCGCYRSCSSSQVGCGSYSRGQTLPVLTLPVMIERGGRCWAGFSADCALCCGPGGSSLKEQKHGALDSANQHSLPPGPLQDSVCKHDLCVGVGGCPCATHALCVSKQSCDPTWPSMPLCQEGLASLHAGEFP